MRGQFVYMHRKTGKLYLATYNSKYVIWENADFRVVQNFITSRDDINVIFVCLGEL